MASIPENGVVVSVHAHSIRQHLLLVVQKRVGAEVVCEIGTLVDPAAFDRTPRPGGSISLGVHRCVRGLWLSFDPPPPNAERRKQKQTEQNKAKSAGALLRSKKRTARRRRRRRREGKRREKSNATWLLLPTQATSCKAFHHIPILRMLCPVFIQISYPAHPHQMERASTCIISIARSWFDGWLVYPQPSSTAPRH